MTKFEYKGKHYQIEIAEGEAWSYPCNYCDLRVICEETPSLAFCDDYYPNRIYFKKL